MEQSDVVYVKESRRLKIDSSNIGMESARSYHTATTITRRFVITDYQESLEQSGNALNTVVKDGTEQTEGQKGQAAEESNPVKASEWQNRFGISTAQTRMRSRQSSMVSDLKQITIRYIFDLLFAARRNRLNEWMEENGWSKDAGDTRNMPGGSEQSGSYTGQDAQTGEQVLNTDRLQIGDSRVLITPMKTLNYTQEVYHAETEDTSFSTVGTVRTSDGREINFNVNVGMSRAFEEYYREELNMAAFSYCDPLVINMDTDVAKLSDQTFYFDIDADGEKDEISRLGSGSGYLALDKNGDGTINDGSELFGTASGNGFADLAGYDEDGNGWIDENDDIWSKLKIWTKDEDGKDVLYRLADKGVGAIYLKNADTGFTLKGSEGQTQGAIRRTGVFLYENGNAGTIQHVDVAKYSKEA